jgi:hypothetical protein
LEFLVYVGNLMKRETLPESGSLWGYQHHILFLDIYCSLPVYMLHTRQLSKEPLSLQIPANGCVSVLTRDCIALLDPNRKNWVQISSPVYCGNRPSRHPIFRQK